MNTNLFFLPEYEHMHGDRALAENNQGYMKVKLFYHRLLGLSVFEESVGRPDLVKLVENVV